MGLKDQETNLVTSKLNPLPNRLLLLAVEEDKISEGGIILGNSNNMILVNYTIDGVHYDIPISLSVAKIVKVGEEVPSAYGYKAGQVVLVRTGDACDMIIARSPDTGQEWFTLDPKQVEAVLN